MSKARWSLIRPKDAIAKRKDGDALGDLHDDAKNLTLYQMAAGMHKTMQKQKLQTMQSSNDDFLHKKSDAKADVHGLPKDVQNKIEKMWM